eukprot:CAMPEP_0201511752 /NCGR_PEP_ID=MMETSP0161_2-20130828/4159_1 /ASSEMBLY_ACC=CAM_ASM_000251 /TAXON_ID=180227 /ORGANISM="Neoparamoeba aestuarina, Strain SoJaBio B1-5/56/2" /LENGTH=144 /DNA_ID=CAMNT_0047907363 /DNA_START=1 /DNA_END=436 /DNA_ORIENTATION=+
MTVFWGFFSRLGIFPPLCPDGAQKKGEKKPRREKKPQNTVISRDHTIHLHKRLHRITFKNKAPRAIREVKKFAADQMKTSDVRIDAKLNQFLWSKGIRNVPFRVRVRLSRRRNDDDEAGEEMYTYVSHVPVSNYKGLKTEKVEE